MPLRVLDLMETQVTDTGLEYLRGMPLEVLDLMETRVTDAG
jgi:hypothetical protein